jgi:hypothetical protein
MGAEISPLPPEAAEIPVFVIEQQRFKLSNLVVDGFRIDMKTKQR